VSRVAAWEFREWGDRRGRGSCRDLVNLSVNSRETGQVFDLGLRLDSGSSPDSDLSLDLGLDSDWHQRVLWFQVAMPASILVLTRVGVGLVCVQRRFLRMHLSQGNRWNTRSEGPLSQESRRSPAFSEKTFVARPSKPWSALRSVHDHSCDQV